MRTPIMIALLFATLLLSGCGEDSDTPSSVPDVNTAPVADAGPDQTATVGETVTLDGSASSDADSDPLTFLWSVAGRPGGSTADLTNADGEQPSITPDLAGSYDIQLIVNDGKRDSNPDTVSVAVSSPPSGWSAVERIISKDDLPDLVVAVSFPVPVRFDEDTIHLYVTGIAFKTFAVVPAFIYRLISEDNGATWSAPERMAQLEGNYQSYVVGYYAGKLLIVWHDGNHAELHHTALASATDTPLAPTIYVDYATAAHEIIGLSLWSQTMLGVWAPSNSSSSSPFVGEVGADTATLTGISSSFTDPLSYATLIAPDRVIVLLNDLSLWLADFDGVSLSTPETLDFPGANETLEYGGETFYHAQCEQTSGEIYFAGYNLGLDKSGIYRVQHSD